MEESVHVTFDESLPTPTKTLEDEEVVPILTVQFDWLSREKYTVWYFQLDCPF